MSDEELYEVMERRAMLKKIAITTAVTVGVAGAAYLIYRASATRQIGKALDDFGEAAVAAKVNGLNGKEISDLVAKELGTKTDDVAIKVASELSKSDIDDAAFSTIKGLSKSDIDRIMAESSDDVDFVLKSGTKMFRITPNSNKDFSTVKDHMYFSFKESDRQLYKGYLKDRSKTGERYEIISELTKDLKIPREAEARKIFDEVVKNNPKYMDEFFDTLENKLRSDYTKVYGTGNAAAKQIEKDVKRGIDFYKANYDAGMTNPIFEKAWYQLVLQKQDSKILVGEFKNRGYDAFVDYFDRHEFTDMPLIVFDPASSIKGLNVKEVSKTDKEAAKDMVVKMLSDVDMDNDFVKVLRKYPKSR